jgi:uncharacterized membrane protein YkgB
MTMTTTTTMMMMMMMMMMVVVVVMMMIITKEADGVAPLLSRSPWKQELLDLLDQFEVSIVARR